MTSSVFDKNNIPLLGEYDVVICGAGMSGIAAACNAVEQGLKVAIIEYYDKLGGVVVSGLLGIISGWRLDDEIVVDGKFHRELLRRANKTYDLNSPESWRGRFASEELESILLDMLIERNIDIFIHTQVIGANVDNEYIKEIFVCSKSGIEYLKAKLFVDATGDGDLANFVKCPFQYGREKDGKVQSSSLTFKLAGIDNSRVPKDMKEATKIWQKEPHNTPTNHTVITYLPNTNGEAAVNMTHILNCDPLTHDGELKIRYEGKKQAEEIAEYFRKNMSGFEKCYVSQTAMQPGVRETRRFLGDYILTKEDIINNRDFDDEIARCAWGIDVHQPDKIHGETPEPHFSRYHSYGIPYRCITPKNIKNLYIAGRPISATHEAFSSSRINGTCIAIGEAIGVAAPMAIQAKDIRKIDIKLLQYKLEKQNAIVHRKQF